MRHRALFATDDDHIPPLPSLGAVDREELDAILFVGNRPQLLGLVLEIGKELSRGPVDAFGFREQPARASSVPRLDADQRAREP